MRNTFIAAALIITTTCVIAQTNASLSSIATQSKWISTGNQGQAVWAVVETTCKFCDQAWEKLNKTSQLIHWVPSSRSGRLSEVQAAEMLSQGFSPTNNWRLTRPYSNTAHVSREGMVAAKDNQRLVHAASLRATPAFIYCKNNRWQITYGVPGKKDISKWSE